MRCTPSARHAHFAAHHFRLKCAGYFSCFLSFMSLFQCFLASLHAMHTFFPMTYIYVRDLYIFIYKTYKMVCIVCSTPKSPDKSRFKLHTMAKNGVQDSVHGVQGSVHEQRNARIGMACQAHAAPLLYVHPHPTAARRAATLALRTRSVRNAHLLRTEESPTPLLMSVLPDHMTTRKNVVVTIWSAESLGAIRLFAIPDQMTTSFGTYL